MADLLAAFAAEAVVGVTLIGVGCWTVAHTTQIAVSWAAGRAWLTGRRPGVTVVLARAARAARVAGWWLLVHALRAHGRHRRAVAS